MEALKLLSDKPEFIAGSLDQKLGILAIKLNCWAPDMISAVLAPAPEIEVTGLIEWQPRTFSLNKAGSQAGYFVGVTLEGHLNPDKSEDEYFEMEGATAEKPIEGHWNFDVLLDVYGGGKKPDQSTGKMVWPRTLTPADGSNPIPNRMFGTESFVAPGLIWTRHWVAPFLPNSIINDLGTVFQSLPGNPQKIKNPPGLGGGRNWLCIRARGRQRGNIWQLQTSWELSGPFGWIPEMYRSV